MIDPLYDHPCNKVVDSELAKASKADLVAKMQALDGPYQLSDQLERAGRPREALEQLLIYQNSIATLLAPTHHVVLDARLREASMRVELRDYDNALRGMQEVLKARESCLGPNNDFTLEVLSMIAQLQEKTGDFPKSLASAVEVMRRSQIRFDELPEDERASEREQKQLIVVQSNVAALEFRMRQLSESKAGAERIVQSVERLPASDPERYELANSSWYIIDRVAHLSGDLEGQKRALAGLRESYEELNTRFGEGHRRTLPELANLGFAVADIAPAEAVAILRRYISFVEAQRQQIPLPDERRILLEGRANTYQRFAFAAHEAGQSVEAFLGMEWSKSRALRDDLALKGAMRDALLRPDERAALNRVRTRITQLQDQLDPLDRKSDRYVALERVMLEATRDYENRLRAAQVRNPRLQLTVDSQVESPASASRVLKPDEVFISYLTRRVEGPIFEILIALLEPNGRLTVLGPVQAAGLEQSIASWARILAKEGGLPAVAGEGVELYQYSGAFFFDVAGRAHPGAKAVYDSSPLRQTLSQKLLPAEALAVTEKYKRWIISPAGVLWSVPFEALNEGEGRVVDFRIVRYVHSWTMFSALHEVSRTRGPSNIPMLAIGDVKYAGGTQPATHTWPNLEYSKKEMDKAEQLYSLMPGKTVFRGPQALPSTVMKLDSTGALAQANILMLSTHGYLNRARPDSSAIVLGKPEEGTEDDRYLRARDIAQLHLNADLVIVASCDSGAGRVASGEGLLGLPYAFFAAGASAAVLTLWAVNDNADTVVLTSGLLENLKAGLPADEALTLAKRVLRKNAAEDSWAPFSLLSR